MSDESAGKAVAKVEAEHQGEIAKAVSEAPKAKAADKMTWRDMLEETPAWRLLAAQANLEYTDDGFSGPDNMDNTLATRLANAAEIILEGRVRRVVVSTQPALRVGVEE